MMTELQEIDVFIEPNGNVKIEVRGAKGKQCLDITKNMEALLGGNVLDRNYTDEFNQETLEESEKDWLKTNL